MTEQLASRRTVLGSLLAGTGAAGITGLAGAAGATASAASPSLPSPSDTARAADEYDLDTGNAVQDLIIGGPGALPTALAPMDASVVIRITHLGQNAWFDAIAPYHPTAVGIYSDLGRRPPGERATNRHRNIALLYATARVLRHALPQLTQVWRDLLLSAGLDPDDDSEDRTSPVGIGNLAGQAVIAHRQRDGMNQLGDAGGRRYHPRPYADYLGYAPVNTAYDLHDPGRWQPALTPHRRRLGAGPPSDYGAWTVQQFITPQWRVTRPYSYDDPAEFRVPPPRASDPDNRRAYRRQAEEVLEAQAALTGEQKMAAELFDNKFLSLGMGVSDAAVHHGLDLDGWVHLFMTASTATFDTGIAVWNDKHRYDAVRPFSAIRHLYGGSEITAWGGPGLGTVDDLPGAEWRSYLNVGDHPEYPSGSAAFCAAQAQAARRFLDSDEMGYSHRYARGASLVEPGLTPATDLEMSFATWTEFAETCALSRLWGGVHFRTAIEVVEETGRRIGDRAYAYVRRHIDGTARR